MYLKELSLINFRNYNSLQLHLDKKISLMAGDNGQGKTNLLESIYYVSTGKSHRTNTQEDLIKWGSDFAVIRATFAGESPGAKEEKESIIELELNRRNILRIRIDKVPYKKKSDFISILPSVIFSPDDLVIVKGTPLFRRDFLDNMIEKFERGYAAEKNKYQKILNQRNSLLKSLSNERTSRINDTMETWNDNLIRYGSSIIKKRIGLLIDIEDMLIPLIKKFFPGMGTELYYEFSWERQINGSGSENGDFIKNPENTGKGSFRELRIDEIKDRFSKYLAMNFTRELNYKTTLTGPHRDDIVVLLNGRDVRSFGSQGQQRIVALCLKLCELNILEKKLGKKPVLLLDDVLSELDETRENILLEIIRKSNQTFITTTDSGLPEALDLKNHSGEIVSYYIKENNAYKQD